MVIDLSKPIANQETLSNEFETKVLDFVKNGFRLKTVKIQSSGSTGIPKIFEEKIKNVEFC